MTTAATIIRIAQERGILLDITPIGNLHYKGRASSEFIEQLKRHKAEILDALRSTAAKDDTAAQPPHATPPEPRQCVLTRRGVVLLAVKQAIRDTAEQNRLLRFAESESRAYMAMFEIHEQADREWFFCNEIEDYLRDRLGQIIRWQMESETVVGWELVPAKAAAPATAKAKNKQAGQGRLI